MKIPFAVAITALLTAGALPAFAQGGQGAQERIDTAIAREVYGDAARLVTADPPVIADALTTLLTDNAAHDALLAAGRQRLKKYSWTETAASVRRALEEAASRP